MRNPLRLILALIVLCLLFSTLAIAQAQTVPLCNGFNSSGAPIDTATGSTGCTDLFGSGNWANSPLPAGTITGFTMIQPGSGYTNPQVMISDPTGTDAVATATVDLTSGAISGITGSGTNYTMPVVTIVDVGVGGTLAAPMCGTAGQPDCGSGALASAVIGPPFTGGMLKFQDALPDLKALLAVPDTTTFPGDDYYVIGLQEYKTVMHASLPQTTLRGYCQLNNPASPGICSPSYLGPVILAQKNRAVRVLFKNMLPTGAGGNLFIPVDTTYMGADLPQNRATLHLHGGATPWISDGTPHQWTVPIGETPMRGPTTAFVPDMFFDNAGNLVPLPKCDVTVTTNCYPFNIPAGLTNDPGQGSMTFFWTNQQGGRLMFYHDHAYGITRLNVYAGEAAGYLLYDPAEESALLAAGAPGTIATNSVQQAPDLTHLIPLVIQDKSFVPSAAQLAAQDPTWTAGKFGTVPGSVNPGDLWFPHVYMPNQDPSDPGTSNAYGRWDYGPWFFPSMTTLTAANPPTAVTNACTSSAFPGQVLASTASCPTCGCPIIPNPSGTPESFMDTPVVNGKAYPVLHVAPAAYRFQILSAGNDRSWNLSWFVADSTQNNTEVAMLPAYPPTTGSAVPLCSSINPIAVPSLDLGLATALFDATGNPLNGTGLQAGCWPNYGPQLGIPKPQTMWAADGRNGGAPDPRNAGPAWVEIGTEGGLLPAPVVIPATPINYEQNVRSITVGSVAIHGLWLGPAERADAIVDFSKFAGKTLILYNDAPAPAPALDSRVDYFTDDGDQVMIGGAPNTPAGYGPNTRTVMQVIVDGNAPNTVSFSVGALKSAFASTATTKGLFATTQPTAIIPEAGYNSAYNSVFPNTYMAIQADNLTFTPLAPLSLDSSCPATPPAACAVLGQKTIQELFTVDYGRMNATLGTELPFTNFQTQTTIPLGYVDPPTEIVKQGDTQLWKITHNGVDTHFIHFHLFNVQVVNRVGWDGSMRQPDANELGWKDTVRMNPLEDILVALQPITPTLPFPLPDSIRLYDVMSAPGATGMQFANLDPLTGNPVTTVNDTYNFGWEYVWHCHILGHEENDMMRPIVFQVPPPAPINPSLANDPWAAGGPVVKFYWTDMSASASQPGGGFNVQIATDAGFSQNLYAVQVPGSASNGFGSVVSTPFTPVAGATTYYYEVQAFSANGTSAWVVGSGPIQPASTTMLLTTNSPITYGQPGVVTVTVSSPQGIPTGNVALSLDGGAAIVQALPGSTPDTTIFNLSGLSVGTHTVVATYPAAANPLITTSTASGTILVNPPTLTITAGSATVNYGAPVPTITPAYSGFVNGDTPASLTTPPTCTPTYTQGSPVSGSPYTTSCSGAVDPNYNIVYVPGTVVVNAVSLTITASSAAVVFGAPVPAITPSYAGFVNGDTPASLTPQPTCSTTYTQGSPVSGSPYPTSCAGAVDPNYTINYVGGSVTVNKASSTVTITAHNPNPSNVGGAVIVTASVTPQLSGAPTGTVTVTASTGESCAGALSASVASCTLTFTTAGVRTLTATYSGDLNFAGSVSAGVSHTVVGVGLTVNPTSLTFPVQLLNTNSVAQTVTLTNSGARLTALSYTFTDPNYARVAVANNCGTTLNTNASCTIAVRFRPTTAGAHPATLNINAGGTTLATVSLTGSGGAPLAVLGALTPSPLVATRGTTTTGTVTLSNTGTAPLTIASILIRGTNAGQFSQTNNCGTSLAAGANCTVTVTFHPPAGTARGTKNATLRVRDNSNGVNNSLQTTALQGTAQ